MQVLRQDLHKNIYGIASPELYGVSKNGTRQDIELYQNSLIESIRHVYYHNGTQVSTTEKLKFF